MKIRLIDIIKVNKTWLVKRKKQTQVFKKFKCLKKKLKDSDDLCDSRK